MRWCRPRQALFFYSVDPNIFGAGLSVVDSKPAVQPTFFSNTRASTVFLTRFCRLGPGEWSFPDVAVGQNQWYHFGVIRCTTHFRTYFSGWIGMFTGGTIWLLTHGHVFPNARAGCSARAGGFLSECTAPSAKPTPRGHAFWRQATP